MSTVSRWIKPNRSRPGPNDPGILPSRKGRRRRHTARKEELLRLQAGGCDPGTDRVPRLFGDLELHRPQGLLLHDDRARADMTALEHIANVKPHQVAPAQLAVDGEIEQREFPGLDDPVAVESGWPRSPSASAVASGRSASLCSTVLHALQPWGWCLVTAYMNGSLVVGG